MQIMYKQFPHFSVLTNICTIITYKYEYLETCEAQYKVRLKILHNELKHTRLMNQQDVLHLRLPIVVNSNLDRISHGFGATTNW